MDAHHPAFNPEASLASIKRDFGEFGGVNPSIEASTTFTVLHADTLDAIFAGARTPENSACYAYGRAFNPTTRALAKQLAALEGTEAAYAVSSGLAAIAAVVLRICDTGDSFVCARAVYGGTFALFHDFLPTKCGIHCIFVDLDDPQALAAALARPRVKLLYCETLANPTLVVADLPRLAAAAEKRGVPLVVDNTFAPCAVTPAKHGAAVVVHSLTKGISGASDIIAGAVCGSKAFINSLFAFDHGPVFLLGPTLDPKVAAELGLRMPHLPLRVREAGRRAELFARELEAAGARARHPALLSHPQAALFASLANPGYGAGAVITVDAGSLPAASRLMERLQNSANFGLMAVSLGYHETLLSVSGATTSSELSPADQAAAGIAAGLLRVSVGYTGTADGRLAQLMGAWKAHAAAEASRAAGVAPPYRAARVETDLTAPGGIVRVASWDSFGEGVEGSDDETVGANGATATDGAAALAASLGGKLRVSGDGRRMLYVKATAAAPE